MANFEGMSTKKLKGLLETTEVSAEDRASIESVLSSREGHAVKTENGGAAYSAPEEELTETEKELIAEAEAKFDGKQAPVVKTTTKSIEECEALAATLAPKVGCRCSVLPFNEIEWVEGTVVGVHVEKRSNKVLFIIKGDNNKRMLKAHDAKGIKISDTKVEVVKRASGVRTANVVKATDDELEKAIVEARAHVGQYVTIMPFGGTEKTKALIVGIVPDKRVMKVLMRMELPGVVVEVEGKEVLTPGKVIHKMFGSSEIEYTEEWDEARREAYLKRQETVKVTLTPAEKATALVDKIAKAEAAVEAAKAKLDLLKQELATLEEVINGAAAGTQTAETPVAEEDPLA